MPNGFDKNFNGAQTVSAEERQEYFKALEKWLGEAYAWNSINITFAQYLLASPVPSLINNLNLDHVTRPDLSNAVRNSIPFVRERFENQRTRFQQPLPQQNRLLWPRNGQPVPEMYLVAYEVISHEGGYEYRLPPLWKRFVAEFIDFFILFFLKLAVTFIAVDFFDFIDLDKYGFDMLQKSMQMDYKKALQITSDIVILEIIHKVIVCLFEAYWLQGGLGGRPGGATPGKALIGIRVVMVTAVIPGDERDKDIVVAYPCTDLGFWLALGRSLLKNFLLALLFPVCFALFFFQFNRTGYDMVCNSLVVEDDPNPPRRRRFN